MEKKEYQAEVLKKVNADGSARCEICGKDSMLTHAFIDHSEGTVKVMCHACYVKQLNKDNN